MREVDEKEEIRRDISDDFKTRGFQAGGEPVYSAEGDRLRLSDLLESLAFSSSAQVKTIVLPVRDRQFVFTVGRLEKVYATSQDGRPLCDLVPDWRFEGWLVTDNYSPKAGKFQVRGFVENGPSGFEKIEIQVIPEFFDPDGIIDYVDL